jgi:hypothetical protein
LPASSFAADWRRFADPRFRVYHYLALCQGVVAVLAGFEVIIPFSLALGAPPPVAVLLGVLPLMGGMAQLAVPRMLNATDGNLPGLTIFFAAISEPRGLWFAALAVLFGAGIIGGPLAIVALGLLVAIGSVTSSIVAANLLSWHSAVLSEEERRLVVPRLMAVSLAIGAILLFPIAALIDVVSASIGIYAYVIPLLLSGALGVAQVYVLRRLRNPGRVIVPPRAVIAEAPANRQFDSFMRVSVVNALGMGFTPALSVYAISILGLTAGFSMMVASVSTLTMVVAAAVAGARLAHGSSERMLRTSFAIRVAAMVAAILALPGTVTAPALLMISGMLGSIGFASGSLAANERLFRLIKGPVVIRQHARYLAQTSGAMTVGQFIGAGAVAFGYPAFVALYVASGLSRVVAFRLARPVAAPAATKPMPAADLDQTGVITVAETGVPAAA